MKTRFSVPTFVLLASGLLIAAALLVDGPRAVYTRRAVGAYNSAISLWESAGPAAYTMLVANNSLHQATAGWNTIRVQDARVVEGHNPDCPECSLADFEPLTVEALFRRVRDQCLLDFPRQFCGVAYDDTLGYPRRLDTYPHNLSGVERPSITVESVIASVP